MFTVFGHLTIKYMNQIFNKNNLVKFDMTNPLNLREKLNLGFNFFISLLMFLYCLNTVTIQLTKIQLLKDN